MNLSQLVKSMSLWCRLPRSRWQVRQFELARGQALVADDDAVRDADQVGVGEHRSRPLAAVVEQHLDAGRRQFAVKLFRGRFGRRVELAE